MKIKILIALGIIVLALGYFSFCPWGEERKGEKMTLTDTDFGAASEYVCADGKTLGVAFSMTGITRVSLSDKRVFTLEQMPQGDTGEVKHANEGDQIVLWTMEEFAYLMENGTTTYAACGPKSLGELP